MAEICVLVDGRRVSYSLKRRGRDPFYLACFRGPDGGRKERSTHEPNEKRARDAAVSIIRDEFAPQTPLVSISWDKAVAEMIRAMKAQNLRPRTVEDYELALDNLRAAFPKTWGPSDITTAMAKQYKLRRIEAGRSAYTVAGNINKLGVIWRKWLIKQCDLVSENPWQEVEQPKTDDLRPQILSANDEARFFGWLTDRWDGWLLPVLLLRVKAAIGCRLLELCTARTADLQEGRLHFESRSCKGRKARQSKLPVDLYEEVRSIAGPTFLWERFPEGLRTVYRNRGKHRHALAIKDFSPVRLKRWIQNEKDEYLWAHEGDPTVRHFKLHNLRGTAMSRAKQAGATYDRASIAFGCHPETMRRHYLQLDETAISDAVFDQIQSGRAGNPPPGPGPHGKPRSS